MTTEMCIEGWKLRSDYLNSLVNRDLPYFLYIQHIRNCSKCQAHFAELREAAEKAEHPDIEE